MADHIVRSFDADLDALGRGVAELGGLAESMTTRAIEALVRQSPTIANEVIALDTRLDTLQQEIEEKAVLTIARRQPMAVDLRAVIAAIRVTHDLERIGDLAKNICKRVLAITGLVQAPKLVKGVEHLSQLVLTQLKDVLDAYVERNADKALDVWRQDEDIDALYTSLFRELLTYMMEDPAQHRGVRPSSLLRQEYRAHGRPRDQRRRERLLSRDRLQASGRARQGRHDEPRETRLSAL